MAIPHFSRSIEGRKDGKSAIAAAAYRHADKLTDERTGEIKDYSNKQGVLASWIQTPDNAPAWASDRAQLWNRVELREDKSTRRSAAQLFTNDIIALPCELTLQQNEWLLRDFVKENYTRRGMVADVAIHAPDSEGDQRNIHAHIMGTLRRIEGDEFTDKLEVKLATKGEQDAARQAELLRLRGSWEKHVNRQLKRWGHETRLDMGSFKARGIKQEPTKHKGVHATGMQRKGKRTERAEDHAATLERNALRAEIAAIEKKQRRLDRHLSRLEALELEQMQREANARDPDHAQRGNTQYAIDRLREIEEAQKRQPALTPEQEEDRQRRIFEDALREAEAQENENRLRQ